MMWQGRKNKQKSQWLNIISPYFSLRLDCGVAEQPFSTLLSHHGQHEKQELPSCCWRKEVGEESLLLLNCSSLEGKWVVKNPPTKAGEVETCAQFLGQEDPPTPGFLPGEFHGQRSLVGYSPWGHHWATNTFTSTICYPQTQAVGQKETFC